MLPIELKAPVIYPEQLNIKTLMSFQGVPTVGDSSQWNYPQLSMATRPNWCLFFSRLLLPEVRSFPVVGRPHRIHCGFIFGWRVR